MLKLPLLLILFLTIGCATAGLGVREFNKSKNKTRSSNLVPDGYIQNKW